jgi:hypothetical protein
LTDTPAAAGSWAEILDERYQLDSIPEVCLVSSIPSRKVSNLAEGNFGVFAETVEELEMLRKLIILGKLLRSSSFWGLQAAGERL